MSTEQSEFEILQDRTALEACYQSQIDAIMACDYEAFCDIIGSERLMSCDSVCWGLTAHYQLSLFANLPNCSRCASQIQTSGCYPMLKELVCKGSNISLPSPEDDDIDFKFTSAELLEFNRRQLVARFNKDGSPRQLPEPTW